MQDNTRGPKKGPPENENTLAETEGLEGAGNDRGCTERARALGASRETVVMLAGGAWGGGGGGAGKGWDAGGWSCSSALRKHW